MLCSQKIEDQEGRMASLPMPGVLEEPSADDRTIAMLAHLLMAFTGFIGPLVIFVVKQNSRFVRFHSLQALVWQAAYMVLVFLMMAVFFVLLFLSVMHNPTPPPHTQGPPPTFVFFFPVIWLSFMGGWVINLILGVVYAIKANRGEWATYPVLGKWLLPERQ
jgi:uncharacterized Tic20 family protein